MFVSMEPENWAPERFAFVRFTSVRSAPAKSVWQKIPFRILDPRIEIPLKSSPENECCVPTRRVMAFAAAFMAGEAFSVLDKCTAASSGYFSCGYAWICEIRSLQSW
jgi:hypothetical protein